MDVQVGDRLMMKKPHPCGGRGGAGRRGGMAFRRRGGTGGRERMIPGAKAGKAIRKIRREEETKAGVGQNATGPAASAT